MVLKRRLRNLLGTAYGQNREPLQNGRKRRKMIKIERHLARVLTSLGYLPTEYAPEPSRPFPVLSPQTPATVHRNSRRPLGPGRPG